VWLLLLPAFALTPLLPCPMPAVDSLKTIRFLIMNYHKDPNHISTIRQKLNDASRDIILLKEVLEYLKESLEEMKIPPVPDNVGGRRLFKVRLSQLDHSHT